MTPYFFVLILFLIGFNARKKKPFFLFCALCMFLIVAMRAYSVGTDTQTYLRWFVDKTYIHSTEPLWDLYVMFVRSQTDNTQLFLASNALITLIPFFYLIYKKSSYALLSLFVYFILPNDQGYIFTMTGMRQALAATVVMFEFYAYEKKKWLVALLMATIAFSIHNSSIIAVIGLLIMPFVKITQKTGVVVLILSAVFMVVSVSVADVWSFISNSQLMKLEFMEDYANYATYMIYDYNITLGSTLFLVVPIFMMITLLLLNPSVLETIYARLYILGGSLLCAMSQVPMVSRYYLYFILTEVFLIPQIYNSTNNKNNKQFCVILITFQTVILFLYLYHNYENGLNWNIRRVTPYYFFFNAPYNPFI